MGTFETELNIFCIINGPKPLVIIVRKLKFKNVMWDWKEFSVVNNSCYPLQRTHIVGHKQL